MKNIPILSFFRRYWLLIVVDVLLVMAACNDYVFRHVGSLVYVPAIGLLCHLTALLGRHLFYSSTTDQDANDGTFALEWHTLSPERRTTLSVVIFAVIFLGMCLIASGVAHGETPDQWQRWSGATVDARRTVQIDNLIARYQRTSDAYLSVEAMRANGVPAPVAFCLFYRECDNNFADSPAQGDPLTHRSRNVPAGRLPGKPPPYAWAEAAEDAYYVVDRLDLTDWRDTDSALNKIESFNGFGYRARHVASPYLWAGTSLYLRGKYTGDGRYDPLAVDRQLGVAAILLRMRERGLHVAFD